MATAKKQTKAKTTKSNGKAKAAATPQKGAQSDQKQSVKPTLETAYRHGGGYWAATMALKALGVGKLHPLAKAIAETVKQMKAAKTWDAFSKKKGKLTPEQRVTTNLHTISRKDYGQPLHEIGYHVEYDGREKTVGLMK